VILVSGANGHVGGELVAELVARSVEVRALVRNPGRPSVPDGVDVVAGDLDAPDSLPAALAGVDAVFLLGGFPTTAEVLHRIEDAGVGHVVLLTSRSVIGGDPDNAITRMWLDTETAVRDAAVPWTVLRPSGFHSNALRWRPQLQHGDVVRAPWPDVPIASIDPADIAAVAATALTEPGYEHRALSLSGPEALTPGEQTATLAKVTGRPLRFEPLDDDSARAAMQESGTPAGVIDAFFRFFSHGEFDDSPVVDTVHQITQRRPRTFRCWAETHADAFIRADPTSP
jgi:uncharacterized protein YbjT (DUF2867 family)